MAAGRALDLIEKLQYNLGISFLFSRLSKRSIRDWLNKFQYIHTMVHHSLKIAVDRNLPTLNDVDSTLNKEH